MKNYELDFIVPLELNPDFSTADEVAKAIINQHKKYGIRRFAFFTLTKGWRSIGYPPREEYIRNAEMWAEVKRLTSEYEIELGWFMTLTLKSGHSDEFVSPVKSDGTVHKFSSCPLDINFKKRFAEDAAEFVKIAKPDFIFTEDDFSLKAVNGCFCENHLNEFAKREGKYYKREELVEIFKKDTPEAMALLKRWRNLLKDSLVDFASYLRAEIDKESPGVPMGYMQAGGADMDGDVTEEISVALSGGHHTPFSRLYGTFYCGVEVKNMPEVLFHPLYSKQHMKGDFKFYHESDTYPHNKFYTAGRHMKAMMGMVFSYGYEGSLYFCSGIEFCGENMREATYAEMYKNEINRFNEVYRTVKKCTLKGVEIDYDPFYNTATGKYSTYNPLWVRSIGRFAIPYVSVDSSVAFWDIRQAQYADHETIMKYLSKGLFLDGDAAKCLCERGYSRYIGVEVWEDVVGDTKLIFDLSACEIIRDEFNPEYKGSRMASAYMYCPPGNGKWLKIDVTDDKCEIVSDAITFHKEPITPAMTRFENELGGKVVVMSLTLDGNNSQALFNYDRQKILQKLVSWCSDEFIYAVDVPDMNITVNEANTDDFIGMITMLNLCEDTISNVKLHLPEKWQRAEKIYALDCDALWKEISFEKTDDGVILNTEFEYIEPVYIKMA